MLGSMNRGIMTLRRALALAPDDTHIENKLFNALLLAEEQEEKEERKQRQKKSLKNNSQI